MSHISCVQSTLYELKIKSCIGSSALQVNTAKLLDSFCAYRNDYSFNFFFFLLRISHVSFVFSHDVDVSNQQDILTSNMAYKNISAFKWCCRVVKKIAKKFNGSVHMHSTLSLHTRF